MKSKSAGKIWHMSVHERNGLLLFFLLSIVLILIIKNINQKTAPVFIQSAGNQTKDEKNNNRTEYTRGGKKGTFKNKTKKFSSFYPQRKRFRFNPNTISADSFRLLGFSKFTSENLIKYRQKGGVINSLKQMKNMYGIDTSLVNELAEEIYFNSEKTYRKKEDYQGKKIDVDPAQNHGSSAITNPKSWPIVELNEADSISLLAIKGIGPYYASKIIKMKKKMGGFFNVNQLMECKIIPDSVFHKIEKFLVADPSKMEKIDINKADFKTLIQHPYMKENLVKVILHYRDNHGMFHSVEQLKNIKILNRETYEKLFPHFKTENR